MDRFDPDLPESDPEHDNNSNGWINIDPDRIFNDQANEVDQPLRYAMTPTSRGQANAKDSEDENNSVEEGSSEESDVGSSEDRSTEYSSDENDISGSSSLESASDDDDDSDDDDEDEDEDSDSEDDESDSDDISSDDDEDDDTDDTEEDTHDEDSISGDSDDSDDNDSDDSDDSDDEDDSDDDDSDDDDSDDDDSEDESEEEDDDEQNMTYSDENSDYNSSEEQKPAKKGQVKNYLSTKFGGFSQGNELEQIRLGNELTYLHQTSASGILQRLKRISGESSYTDVMSMKTPFVPPQSQAKDMSQKSLMSCENTFSSQVESALPSLLTDWYQQPCHVKVTK